MKHHLYDILNAAEVIHVDGEQATMHVEKQHKFGGGNVVGLCETDYGFRDPRWVAVGGDPKVELLPSGCIVVKMFDTENDPDCEHPEEAEEVHIDLFMLRPMQLTDI